jgi:hypothetical protein
MPTEFHDDDALMSKVPPRDAAQLENDDAPAQPSVTTTQVWYRLKDTRVSTVCAGVPTCTAKVDQFPSTPSQLCDGLMLMGWMADDEAPLCCRETRL